MAREAPGVVAAVAAAAAFSTSGILLKPMLSSGWSPAAAVAVRVALGGLILALPALLALRWRLHPLLAHWRLIVGYGLIAVAGTQVLYFAAIERLPIAVALLIQYSAPTLIMIYAWVLRRSRIRALAVAGVVMSVIGLVLVVDPFGASGPVDGLGVALAFAAALCLAGYYLISAIPTPDLPPLALASTGLIVGALATFCVGITGIVPWSLSDATVSIGGRTVEWWVPMILVALVATAAAYSLSLFGSRRLGSRVASFMGLIEVLFATALAWIVLGQQPAAIQVVGGCFVLVGVVLVKLEQPEPDNARPSRRSVGDPPSVETVRPTG